MATLKARLVALYNAAEAHQDCYYADGEEHGNDAELFGLLANEAGKLETRVAELEGALQAIELKALRYMGQHNKQSRGAFGDLARSTRAAPGSLSSILDAEQSKSSISARCPHECSDCGGSGIADSFDTPEGEGSDVACQSCCGGGK